VKSVTDKRIAGGAASADRAMTTRADGRTRELAQLARKIT
jgi:hypothetical protein